MYFDLKLTCEDEENIRIMRTLIDDDIACCYSHRSTYVGELTGKRIIP